LKNIEVEDLKISENDKKHSVRYQPTRLRHFRNLMKKLNLPEDSVFVDMGSGKGRVLLMAAQFNFKQVRGIEISGDLCAISRNNVLKFEKRVKRSLPVEIIESDVVQYSVKDNENVFYLFKPFDSYIMRKVLENIKSSLLRNPRKVWLIFNNFQYHELFDGEQLFQRTLVYAYGGTEFIVYETN